MKTIYESYVIINIYHVSSSSSPFIIIIVHIWCIYGVPCLDEGLGILLPHLPTMRYPLPVVLLCSNDTLDDVAAVGECCPYGRDTSLNLLVLVYVSGALSDYALIKQNYTYTLAHRRTYTQSIFCIHWHSLCMLKVCNIHQKDNTHAIYYTQIAREHSKNRHWKYVHFA